MSGPILPSQTAWLSPFVNLQKLITHVIVDRAGDASAECFGMKCFFPLRLSV